jgi:oligosaccharide repeat unit polymerase
VIAAEKDSLVFVLEAALLGMLLAAGTLLANLNLLSLSVASHGTLLLLLGLILMSWKRLDHGRHPCFLFLGMLFIFQCGRLLLPLINRDDDPFRIQLGTAIPFDVSARTAFLTLLVILLSAVSIYLPCRWRPRRIVLRPGWEQEWLPAAYCLLAITLPFTAYKNYLYLSYIFAHGGYLAVFTQNDALIATAGFVVRTISLMGSSLFMAIVVMEHRTRLLAAVTGVFVLISVLDLLIGFRGKFFLLILTLWYISKLKSGRGFRLIPLVVIFCVLSTVAVLIADFRENTETNLVSPVGFLASQGTSMQVTELAIDQYDRLARHGTAYLICGFIAGFSSNRNLPDGSCLDLDISRELSPSSFEAGYATGSSYLGELYLCGGAVSIFVCSLLIGLLLRWMHGKCDAFWGALLTILLAPALVYLPRSNLLNPAATLLKSLMILAGAVPCLFLIRFIQQQIYMLPASARTDATRNRLSTRDLEGSLE